MPRVLFIGVSTSSSSVTSVFPLWADVLGADAVVEGRDLPIGAPASAYRDLVLEISDDDSISGAVVTTHKVNVYRGASDLFGALDDWTRLCEEVSSIAKPGGVLTGGAIDPVSSGRVLDEMVGPGHWDRTGAHALVIGAGGAGVAIAVRLLTEARGPASVIVADRDGARIRRLEDLAANWPGSGRLECVHAARPDAVDRLVAGVPGESLVVNATGAGKDTPGSPVTDSVRWPARAVVWELNYRGSLEFLAQARRAERGAQLRVFDGWRLFVHGWTEGLVRILGTEFSTDLVLRMSAAAAPFRP